MPRKRKTMTEQATEVDEDLITLVRKNKRLALDLKSAKARNQSLLEQLEAAEAKAEVFESLSECEVRYDQFKRLPANLGGDTTAILVLTDWHIEERVDRKTTNGLNRYTPTIAKQRAEKAANKFVDLVEKWRKFATIDHVVIGVLGDIITGYIHDELQQTNYLSPTEACVLARDILCNIIRFIQKKLKLPVDVVTCNGNHGRTTRKMQHKNSYKNSWEWLLYQTIVSEFRNDKDVTFHVGEGYHNQLVIKSHKVRFHHGDSIKYNGGVGGITIPVNKSIAAWNKKNPADLDVFGHFHTFCDHWSWVSCGCLIGYSEYALAIKAEYQPATQTMILLSKDHGKVLALPIFVE